ncbi:MAG: 4Fe-4S binding protein [Anaerolineaceae bacterium]|nr:4Fe-4S binding protein [Anaerolineaceae bacterium]
MVKQLPTRQRVRRGILTFIFLTFPITINYLSPYVIIEAGSQGIINGSLIMFGILFLSSLFLGRAWCGWICPGGAMQDIIEPVNNKVVNGKKIDWIKWVIWIPWISIIVWMVIQAGGYSKIDFFYLTENGISVDEPMKYIIYYFVIFLMMGIAALVGRRASCHSICWMAPFMMIGRWIRNKVGWGSLKLASDSSDCTNCKLCTRSCPMSLDVNGMVQASKMEDPECILCGTCIDQCPQGVIRYAFAKPSK